MHTSWFLNRCFDSRCQCPSVNPQELVGRQENEKLNLTYMAIQNMKAAKVAWFIQRIILEGAEIKVVLQNVSHLTFYILKLYFFLFLPGCACPCYPTRALASQQWDWRKLQQAWERSELSGGGVALHTVPACQLLSLLPARPSISPCTLHLLKENTERGQEQR